MVNETFQAVIHPPRKLHLALKDKVKLELDRMERDGVMVKQCKPTKCLTFTKSHGKIQICIDPET
jgi:hypothetical protein